MSGVFCLEKRRIWLELDPELAKALDEYLLTLIPRRSRNSIIGEACAEFLKAKGMNINHHSQEPGASNL